MDRERELDRHLVELVLLAANGREEVDREQIAALVDDMICLNPGRSRSYFHAGFAEELLAIAARPAPDEPSSRWQLFGRLDALLRQGKSKEALEMSALPGFAGLLDDPAIGSPILARLAQACHDCHDTDGALEYLDQSLGSPDSGEAQAMAMGLVNSYLSRADHAMKDGKLDDARDILEAISRHKRLMDKIGYLAVRTLRKLGQCEQRSGDWQEALARFESALHMSPSDSQRAVIWCDIGLCHLGLSSINNLAKGQPRDRPEEARAAFEKAVLAGGGFSINGAFALGALALENGDADRAGEYLEMAHRSLKAMKMRSRSRIEPRIKAYLAEALLMGKDARAALPKALNLLSQSKETGSGSLTERFNTYRLLRTVDSEAAIGFLGRLDLSHPKHFAEGYPAGQELLLQGEWAKVLELAEGLGKLFLRKTERRDVLTMRLKAENALADSRSGLATYEQLKQLCLDQEFFSELDLVLLADDCTGEILDALERRKESLELYGLMPERKANRAALLLELARHYLNGKDEEGLRSARALLEEAALHDAELPAAEVESLAERLELEAQRLGIDLGNTGSSDATLAQRLRARFPSPPRILVVGGNEKQMGDHPSFVELGNELHFVPEWVPANYVNPDKTLAIVRSRLQQGLKALILLHYNRTEFGRSARKLAGEHQVVLRNLHLYGFKSLRACVLEVLDKLLRMSEERPVPSAAKVARG